MRLREGPFMVIVKMVDITQVVKESLFEFHNGRPDIAYKGFTECLGRETGPGIGICL